MVVTHHRRPQPRPGRRRSARRRRLVGGTGAALLVVALAGCSGLGRTAVGPLDYETQRAVHVKVNSPEVTGCHRLGPNGAVSVENGTLVDAIMYPSADCSGGDTVYVATMTSDVIAPGEGPWRSYSFVH
ncbi:hypothetical protein ACH4E8_23835 [Streptomyces sp. NPDC017979]|uniref:hypothetical protein n=1 Tax=Streptomyces sp. NPDC017979 TaxID=3365024 RepID=UPI003794F289